MRYTSNEKLDLDEINKKAKSTGFSDKTRKYLSSVLLGIHIMGAVPSFGNEVQATEYDLNTFNGPQFEEVFERDNDLNKDILDKVVKDFGSRGEIDRTNLDEFKNLNSDAIGEKIDKAIATGTIDWMDGIFSFSKAELQEAKQNGMEYYATFNPDNPRVISRNGVYSIDQIIQIQEFFEKHFADIRDNPNLSEKDKVIAASMKLSSLMTYDYDALERGTDYHEATKLTARNQYGVINYGTGVCMAYAESMEIIGDMFDVDIESISVLTDGVYNNLSPEMKAATMQAMQNGERLPHTDHQVNIVTFSDGTSCMLDVTNHDIAQEAGAYERGDNNTSQLYFTDASSFLGAKDLNGKSFAEYERHRDMSTKCTEMSRADIEVAQERILQEIPSIAMAQQMDEIQRDNGFSKAEASRFFKFTENVKSFISDLSQRLSGNTAPQLPSAQGIDLADNLTNDMTKIQQNEIINSDMVMNREEEVELASVSVTENEKEKDTPTNTYQNDFRAMIAGNGQYRRNVEEYMQNYQSSTKDNQDRILEEDELEM